MSRTKQPPRENTVRFRAKRAMKEALRSGKTYGPGKSCWRKHKTKISSGSKPSRYKGELTANTDVLETR